MRRLYRIAESFWQSGIYKDVKQASQAFAKLVVGRELGLGIAQSMQAIQFVEGQVQIHYSMLGWFVRAHGYSFKYATLTDDAVAIDFYGPDGEFIETSTFTQEDARKAGLDKDRGSAKSNYVKYPRNMLIARAMSNAVKWFLQDALGGIPVYVEGEITPTPELTAGEGDGSAPGIELGPRVDAVIDRAVVLGHAGYSDRATIEVALGGRSPEVVNQWVSKARAELDEIAASRSEEPADAEVVPDGPLDAPGDASRPAAGVPRGYDAETAIAAQRAGESLPDDALGADASDLPELPADPLHDGPSSDGSSPPQASGSSSPPVVGAGESVVQEPSDLAVLRRRLSGLLDQQAAVPPDSPDAEVIAAEVEWLEGELREHGGDLPGQEAMDLG
jgi:hypothetical protein